MKQFLEYKVACSICGGEGYTDGHTAAAEWLGHEIVHEDPEVCRRVLEKRAEELKEK